MTIHSVLPFYICHMIFHEILMKWFQGHSRSFPWRENTNPYNVWISEIILQQTRAAQGLPYYKKFVKNFPNLHSLAEACQDDILKLWEGLGYYSRAINLHATAIKIMNDYGGNFPNDYQEIRKLKGIGDYTASAIASICFGQKHAVVDGNVFRVLSRIFGIDTPIDTYKAKKVFKRKSTQLMMDANPGEYNQALMEFGALQCKPKRPICKNCIFINDCIAFNFNKVNDLPVKTKKINIKTRFFNYIVIINEQNKTILEKRTAKGIWRNLYQFPLIEELNSNEKINESSLKKLLSKYGIDGNYYIEKWNEKPIIHKLTHQHLKIDFWILKTVKSKKLNIEWSKIDLYPMPKALQNFKENFFIN